MGTVLCKCLFRVFTAGPHKSGTHLIISADFSLMSQKLVCLKMNKYIVYISIL